jgi:3-oxoacyl-[acyl-carrier protein] reductase
MYDLRDQVAIVTGGGQGIGESVARRLAADGADVAILDISERARQVADEITGSGRRGLWLRADVSDREQVEAAFATVADTLGTPSILVSNAGVTRDNLVHKMSDEDWDTVVDIHLKGGFICGQVAQRYMVPAGGGKMVFLSSRASLGSRGQANYASAKAGLIGLARTLAVELGRFDINVNVVIPGHIDTEMVRQAAVRARVDYEEMCRRTVERNAIKRVGEPADIANAIAFLVSDQASYITGEVLHVTGRPPM